MSRHARSTFQWLTAALFVLTVAAIAFATFGAFDAIHKASNDPITRKAIENAYPIHIALGSATRSFTFVH